MWSKPGLVKIVPTDIFALEATEMMGSEAFLGAVCYRWAFCQKNGIQEVSMGLCSFLSSCSGDLKLLAGARSSLRPVKFSESLILWFQNVFAPICIENTECVMNRLSECCLISPITVLEEIS